MMIDFILVITLAFMPVTTFADYIPEQISEKSYLSNIGNCPCPYNTDKAGNLCGKRSAWCRQGGYAPACNLTNLTQETIEACKHDN